MGQGPLCYIPKLMEIGPLVPKKKIIKTVYQIWAWKPSGHVTNIILACFHFLVYKPYKQKLVKKGKVVSDKKKTCKWHWSEVKR